MATRLGSKGRGVLNAFADTHVKWADDFSQVGGVRAREPFEGCRFRLVLEDRCDDLRPDASVIPLVSDD